MKASVLIDDKEIRFEEVPEPHPGRGQVLVRVHWASICGTDLHIYLGEFKPRVTYPRILGHECSGVVESVGEGVSHLREGDRVVVDPIIWCNRCPACLNGNNNACHFLKLIGVDVDGAFSEYVVADADKVFKIPEEMSLREAVLVELYSIGVHSTRRAMIEPGDRVVILGAGRLGLSVLEVIRQTGASWVCSVDILENRLEIAKRLGADLTINALKEDPCERILSITSGFGVDRVIETVGTAVEIKGREMPVEQAVRMARHGGRIVVMGMGSQSSPVFWKGFVEKEIQLVGSRVTLGDFPRALSLMSRGRFHPDLLISKEFGLEKTGEAFRLLEEQPDRYLKFLIRVS
ncbi:MAG: alcohol dehydrogenase catalytic domain-containing protein [Syntrophaceae bacterium]|nr:alcohol dehydrogenase catalytic domain-containing protein [Syntrophaceae bacterium]